MRTHEMDDEELVKKYRELRRETKHNKRGRGMAVSSELDRAKKRCLLLKDEIDRRGLNLEKLDRHESTEPASAPPRSVQLTVVPRN